jgi:hypothetical protein
MADYILCLFKSATSWDGIFFEKFIAGQPVKKFPTIMEPKDPLPFSQMHTTERCPEPDESSLHPHTLITKHNCIIVLIQ